MEFAFVVFIGTTLFAYALVAKLLARSPISGPLFFMIAGLIAYWVGIIPIETATFTMSVAAFRKKREVCWDREKEEIL